MNPLLSQGGVKVLITGPWSEVSGRYSCMFDQSTVPASLIQPGVLRCYCPVPADGAVGVEVEGHQAFWTCDYRPFILVLTTVPPHTGSLGVSTKTKAGLVTEDDPLPF
ncbi:hypothetical protein NFI96_004012 [Prochilodus magdalenae]|nr:hypothetical protein NFI96_004012 [Prochilodus magdalenae]